MSNEPIDVTRLRKRKDYRAPALVALTITIGLIGWLIDQLPDTTAKPMALEETVQHQQFQRFQTSVNQPKEETVWTAPERDVDPYKNPDGHARQAKAREASLRLQQALAMLEQQQVGPALRQLNRVLALRPNDPAVLTHKGFALISLGSPQEAFDAFDRALDIDPTHAMAYYGAAVALEALGELEAALSGMRSFLHTTEMGPEKLYVARARSAIWEWEAQLGRGPWGPTRGVPPGFTEEEVRRDGRGVGIKMPIPETTDEEGRMQYEIKAADKIEMFER